jgi:hypothetical protein
MNIPSSSWTTPINFGTNGEKFILDGVGGYASQLNYGGVGPAITCNVGAPNVNGGAYGTAYGIYNIFFFGPGNSGTSTAFVAGGSNGCAGALVQGNTFKNWGIAIQEASNTWNFEVSNNTLVSNGQDFNTIPSNNSGENVRVLYNLFIDCISNGVYQPTNCINFVTSSVSNAVVNGNSFDTAWMHIAPTNIQVAITQNHFENEAVSTGAASSSYLVIDTSTLTSVFSSGNIYMNDSSSTNASPTSFITNNSNLYSSGDVLDSNAGITTVRFVLNGSQSNNQECGLQNINGAVTNIFGQDNTGLNATSTQGSTCVTKNQNGFSFGIVQTGNVISYNGFGGVYETQTIPAGGNNTGAFTSLGNTLTPTVTLLVRNSNTSTLEVGDSANSKTGCLEIGSASGTFHMIYVFFDTNATLFATTTRPTNCDVPN